MRVLFVTSEVAPVIKTGGLADVSAALPAALQRLGDDVRVLLPGYTQVLTMLQSFRIEVFFSKVEGFPDFRLLASTLPSGVFLWVIDCPALYERNGGIYQDGKGNDWTDNFRRFGLLSKVAAILGGEQSPVEWRPEIVHCNDWQAGLTAAYLHFAPGGAPTVMTVHNLAFQGIFPARTVAELALPAKSFHPYGLEYCGNMSFLKAGLYYANHITTVSPNYAREIQTDALGFGLQGLLRSRSGNLTGILNGIDDNEWNPAIDPALVRNYDAGNMAGKAANKLELQRRLGLHVNSKIPLLGVVSRFTYQKGLDAIIEIAPQLIAEHAQLVLLGSGDAAMQDAALALANNYPGQIAAIVGFDEGLSHLIEAGIDVFLMPSRFEPCGLNQMYSQRYGTPPVVHATGGLADSVIDCNPVTLKKGEATGFVFDRMTPGDLMSCIRRALVAYHDKKTWFALRLNCMKMDFGWHKSAQKYHEIYLSLHKEVTQEVQEPVQQQVTDEATSKSKEVTGATREGAKKVAVDPKETTE